MLSLQGFTFNLTSGVDFVRDYVFKKARETVMKKTGGLYPAPLKILDATKAGCDKGLKSGYEAEAKGFGELVMSSEAKALMGLFFAQVRLFVFSFLRLEDLIACNIIPCLRFTSLAFRGSLY